jgi:hypothetical protein
MESAIPEHLQTARTRHRRVGDDYAPPYPSFVARHRPSVTRVVEAAERKMYLGDVEPVLREGMDFLRDQGRSIGCYANRYMTVIGSDGAATEKSYA